MTRRSLLKLASLLGLDALFNAGCTSSALSTTAPDSNSPNQETSAMNQNTQENVKVKVKVFTRTGDLVVIEQPKIVKTDAEWRKLLTAEQYQIARAKGTEPPFCGNLLDNHKNGIYSCICCKLPLFASNSKFNSGTGWPSFFQPVAAENVLEHSDRAYGMVRTEVLCARCDCHIGHVFDDGPRPTGLRFCANSESLFFTDQSQIATLADPAADALSPTTQPAKS